MADPQVGRLSISTEQRDLLYERIYRNLAGIDSLWNALSEGEFDRADRLSHELIDELTLVMNDLGWGERDDDQPIKLETSPEILRRVVERLHLEAKELDQVIDGREAADENRRLSAACEELLNALAERDEHRNSSMKISQESVIPRPGEGER
jgi:hypothetical protein